MADSETSKSRRTEENKREPKLPEFQPREIVLSNWTALAIILSFSTLLTSVVLHEIRQLQPSDFSKTADQFQPNDYQTLVQERHKTNSENQPKYAVFNRSPKEAHLKHVYLVLERLGYVRVNVSEEWDLLWAHDYPFRVLYDDLYQLKPYQKVNHLPGCGYITNKVDLSTTSIPGAKFFPKAFKLPSEKEAFIEYAEKNPEKLFVEKNNEHRNIQIKEVSAIELNSNDSFVQEFIDRPFLVDGYKFDIGVYVIITSVEPLRLYIYNGDILFRYCMVPYYPFDKENIDKYVVGDDYLPTWEVPSLKTLYSEMGYSMRDSFDAYVRQKGRNPSVIWSQVEDAIQQVVLAKEDAIKSILQTRYKSKASNFFEMIRFDLIIDDDLNVYLMEANMSPNLSSAHYPPNQLLYEQVLYNMLGLVGIGQRVKKSSLAKRSSSEENMITSDKNIAVFPLECSKHDCSENCHMTECELCAPCLTSSVKNTLVSAYREFVNRGDCKRIFPPKLNPDADIERDIKELSPSNQLIYRWFHGKCQLNPEWC